MAQINRQPLVALPAAGQQSFRNLCLKRVQSFPFVQETASASPPAPAASAATKSILL
jgi:hypothetical protein